MPSWNVIPNATLASPLALPNYGTLANAVPTASEQQLTVSAANAPIPLGYGRVRVGAKVLNYLVNASGDLLLDCLIGEGTCNALIATDINDAAASIGVATTFYDGTQTTADAQLVAAWALQGVVYADVRAGIAYAVLRIAANADVQIDERSIAFEVEMRKVFDPRQNLALRSIDFSHAQWNKYNCPIIANAITAPDGSLTASLTSNPTSNLTNAIENVVAIPASLTNDYEVSIYVKQGTAATCTFNCYINTGAESNIRFTFATKTLSGAALGEAPSYEELADGWFRLKFTVPRDTVGTATALYHRFWGSGRGVPANNGGTYIWGAQARLIAAGRSSGFVKTTSAAFNPVTQYSSNPALALANFLADAVQGYGDTMDWDSVGLAAARCDEQPGGATRHTVSAYFDEQRPKQDVEDTLRAAAGCFVVREGGTTYLVPDAPVTLAATPQLAAADWMPETLRYTQRGQGSAPNRIVVRYTNTTLKPWAEAYTDPIESADVTAGIVDAVEMVVNAPWITKHAEAVRLRNRYAAEHSLAIRGLEFDAFDTLFRRRRADVIRISNGVDLADKAIRIARLVALGLGRVRVIAQEYSDALYSNDAPAEPVTPGSTLPGYNVVLPVTALTMAEEVYLDQSQSALVASGAKYLSRFRIAWTRSVDRYLLDNVVKFVNGSTTIFEGPAVGTEYVSPPVQQGQTYSVQVQARNVLGFLASPAATASATAQGKLLVPGNVPRISQAIELGGEVLLAWDAAVDIDIIRYEWRYTPNTTGGSWESATFIDRVDSLRARFKGLPVGTHRFYVKAIDSVPQYSATAAYVDITITSDANAFLQALEFVSPTLTNMIAYRVEGERWSRWITAFADTWNTLFPSAMSTYTNPIASYHTAGTSKFVGESQDVGSLITGAWSMSAQVTALSGTVVYSIETSPDNATWTPQAGISYTGAARYVRAVIETTGAMEILRPPVISLAAVTRKESGGPVTSSAGAATTVSLAGKYAKAVRITVTPNGTTARMPTVDNVVLSLSGANSFDVYLFDAAGTQVASSFRWDFEGF